LTPADASRKFWFFFAPSLPSRIVTDHPAQARSAVPRRVALAASLLMGLNACGDDPFAYDWFDTPDTTVIYSLQVPLDQQLGSGFDFYGRSLVQVEAAGATGNWDVALDTQNGALVLLPPGALGITARAGIASMGAIPFADLTQAPGDTLLYELNDPVLLTVGDVYAIRTNRRVGNFGSSCVYYGKITPITLDATAGSMEFQFVTSPICNNRDLVSPN
jgi:hypothetical protein